MKANQVERLHIDAYELNSYFCREKHKKGGVMILSKRGMEGKKVVIKEADSLCEEKLFEFCVVSFKLKLFKFVVVGLYRSPNANVEVFLNRLSHLIHCISKKYCNIIIAGDVNIDVSRNSKEHNNLKHTLKSHNMIYLVDFVTRVFNGSASAIDNVFTNISKESVKITGVITMLSDHDGQLVELSCTDKSHEKNDYLIEKRRNFSKENLRTFQKMIGNESWREVFFSPVEKKYDTFNHIFNYYFNWCFPKISVKIRNKQSSWINENLKIEKQEIINANINARKSKNWGLLKLVRERNKLYKQMLIQTKKNFFDNKIKMSSNISKTTWGILNSEIGNKTKKSKSISIKEGDILVDNPYRISNIFNSYFVGMAKNEGVVPFINSKVSCTVGKNLFTEKQFNLSPTNENEVQEIIDSFQNKHSSGYDEVPIIVIKSAKLQISKILAHLINSSFVCGIFPEPLKISKTIPLYKNNDPKSKTNYRPVSLLPIISKIYEKAAYNRLVLYLEENQVLDDIQHGFRKNKSTITAAVTFIESIINSIDKNEVVVGIFMDLSKAFDSVKHETLISVLHGIGVKNNALKWFKSYLEDRKQFVEISQVSSQKYIQKFKSKLLNISLGVPQGSILGPLLFLCYLKNIDTCLSHPSNSSLCLYADDSNLKISGKDQSTIETISSIEISNVYQFLQERNLNLNIEKTKYVHFKTRQNKKQLKLNITIDEKEIGKEEQVKFLGLLVDSNLTWDYHVQHVLKKINSGIYALRKMTFLCSTTILKQIYYAHIHSHICYGICVYGATKKENLNQILLVQKRAIRLILGIQYLESVKEKFSELNILTVFGLYIYESIMYVKNNKFKLEPLITHNYNTRQNYGHVFNHYRLELFTKKTSYAGNKFLSLIPNHIKNEPNVKKFKIHLKRYLINLSLYSVEEFLEIK